LAKKVTITLDDEILAFVDRQAAIGQMNGNRSAFINAVLREAQRKYLEAELQAAYQRDAQDKTYRDEVAVWDVVVGDGIDA
jgi:Arc/MetJ-type ribon-helix-helix transcriptional regulator